MPKMDIDKLAHLARLSLTEMEKKTLAIEMEEIIRFANRLNDVDADDIDISTHTTLTENVFRADEVEFEYEREDLLTNAPSRFEAYITVPKVME